MIRSKSTRRFSYFLLTTIVMVLFLFALSIGFMKIDMGQVFNILTGNGSKNEVFTIFVLRMPRILITLLMGMALAVSGSVLQTLTKNDLADSGILGINAGAGLGVTIAFLFLDFDHRSIVYLLPLLGFVGAVLSFSVTMIFSTDKNGLLNVDKLILIGIGSSIALSGLMILFVSSAGREDVQFIYKWLSGNIWGDKWSFVALTAPVVIILIGIIYSKSQVLNIMGLDNISTQSLGVNLKLERRILIICSVALAAVVVSVAGSISFIGLIIPHISKKIFGPMHQYNLFGSVVLGAIFLMVADLIGRNILLPQGLLPGIVVSLIGAPYFLYLIIKKQ